MSGALVDVVQADSWTGGLEEKHFSGFSESHTLFFSDDITQQTNIRSTNMKNPLYWAVLVGMTILLMEQGK